MEEEIIGNSLNTYKNNDHSYIDYKKKICVKPWGYEFLCYESKNIGIWFLNMRYNNSTSLHCHLEKDTIIIVLEGLLEIETIDKKIVLNEFENFYIPKRKFHALKSLYDNTKIIEIEVYTNNIEYSDKNDLIRYKDSLKRYDNKYNTSVNIDTDLNKYDYFLINEIKHKEEIKISNNINISLLHQTPINFNNNIMYILLDGILKSQNSFIKSGSIITEDFIPFSHFLLLKIEYNNQDMKKIIKNDNHLDNILNDNKDKKIILTSGCFDILHKGHMKILYEAKKLGDILIVCISSDEQIKYLKGNNRPINSLNDRIELLKSINYIDFILPYNEIDYKLEKTLDDYMCKINPYYWVKGNDYNESDIKKLHPSLQNIKLIDLENNISSTIIINKIKNSEKVL